MRSPQTVEPVPLLKRILWVARVLVFAALLSASAIGAHEHWPDDDRVTPGSDIASLTVELSPSSAEIQQIVYSRAKDGGTDIKVEVTGASKQFRVDVKLVTKNSAGIEFFGPCTIAELSRVTYGSSPWCSASEIQVNGAKDSEQGGDTSNPADIYYKAEFELPASVGYPAPTSKEDGYVGIVVPPVYAEPTDDSADDAFDDDFEWTTYVQIPNDMADVDWTEGTKPDRTQIETPWDLDDAAGERAVVGSPPGPRRLYAEWLLDPDDDFEGWTYPSVTASGDVIAQLNTDEQNLFYSGILLGVAGAAVIALATELFRPWPFPWPFGKKAPDRPGEARGLWLYGEQVRPLGGWRRAVTRARLAVAVRRRAATLPIRRLLRWRR